MKHGHGYPMKPKKQKSTVPKGADARKASNHPGWARLTGGATKLGPGSGGKKG